MSNAEQKLSLALKHLDRVQSSWDPPDWADLSIYGLYCLEAAVEAAAATLGLPVKKQHWDKGRIAAELSSNHGFANVESLMRDLNEARKAEAYGDVVAPDLDAEEVASEIELFVDAVRHLIEGAEEDEA